MSGESMAAHLLMVLAVGLLLILVAFNTTNIVNIEHQICTQHVDHVVCVDGKPVTVDGGVK